jgi:hypothetical protein
MIQVAILYFLTSDRFFWAAAGLYTTSPRASMLQRSCGLFVSIPAAECYVSRANYFKIWSTDPLIILISSLSMC